MRTARATRVLRGFVIAGLATFVAAFSHAIGGGAFPHPALIVAGLVLSGIFCATLAVGRPSWVRLVPSVLVSQAGFHLLFSTGSSGSVLSSTGSGHAGHDVSAIAVPASHGMLPWEGMIAAHAAAAAVTILAVRFGEIALQHLVDSARLSITILFQLWRVVVVEARPSSITATSGRLLAPVAPEHLVSAHHRGPPRLSVPALR